LGRVFTPAWSIAALLAAVAGIMLGSLSRSTLHLGDFALRALCGWPG
jgi:branched-subunit amino acid ABC-type transport system permease component